MHSVVFFGAPHQGMELDAVLALVRGQPTQRLIEDLMPGSTLLENLNEEFKYVVEDVKVIACIELKLTPTARADENGLWQRNGPEKMMVSKESARLFAANEDVVAMNRNHSMIAKLSDHTGSDYWRVLEVLRRYASEAPRIVRRRLLVPASLKTIGKAIEGATAVLEIAVGKRQSSYNGAASGPAYKLVLAIELLLGFQRFLQDKRCVEAAWPHGVATANQGFFGSLSEIESILSPCITLAAVDKDHGNQTSDPQHVNHVADQLAQAAATMHHSLTYSRLKLDGTAAAKIEEAIQAEKSLLDQANLPHILPEASTSPTQTASPSKWDVEAYEWLCPADKEHEFAHHLAEGFQPTGQSHFKQDQLQSWRFWDSRKREDCIMCIHD